MSRPGEEEALPEYVCRLCGALASALGCYERCAFDGPWHEWERCAFDGLWHEWEPAPEPGT